MAFVLVELLDNWFYSKLSLKIACNIFISEKEISKAIIQKNIKKGILVSIEHINMFNDKISLPLTILFF